MPPATPPAPTQAAIPIAAAPTPKKPRDWRKIILFISFGALFLLFLGAGWLIFEAVRNNNTADQQVNNQIANTSIPLSEFTSSGSLNLLGTQSLAVNGQLRANEAFILAPQTKASAERGSLYFDANTNQLAYYNGSQFVQLPGTTTSVQSFQGLTGNVTLVAGNGLTIAGTTITNNGLTSLAGLTGDVTLGNGLSVAGNTLQATGVQSVTSGTPSNLSIVTDGAGNLVISNTGAGTDTVTSGGGSTGRLALFTSAQNIEDSIVSQSGLTVTITGDLSVVTGGLSLSNALTVSNGGTGTNSLAANGVIVGNGTSALSSVTAGGAGLCLLSTAGAPAFGVCPSGSGVTSLNGLTGALSIANASASGSTVTIDNASTSAKGIAQFNSTNFSAALGVINTIQDINTTAAPQFGRLTVASSQASAAMLLVNNTNAGGTGNLLDLQLNGSSRFAVSPAGNVTTSGSLNGQTISSAANFTGTVGIASNATVGGNLAVNGGSITSTGALAITPTGSLTVGSSSQTLSLQGGASSSFVVTSGANSTTLNFQAPTANVTYRIPTATAGSYDLCTTAGNCAGVGGSVTTPGGTTNRLAKFTASGTIGNSSITDTGTTVTTTGSLVVQGGATTIGIANSTTGTLTLAYGGANFSGIITQGALTANRTYNLPDADGTVCLSSGNCLGGSGGGANTSLSNLTSVAINTSLLPGSTTIDLGSTSAPFRNLYLAGSSASPASNNFTITGTATAARAITLPDADGTVCLTGSSSCGFATGSGSAILQGGNTFGAAANIGTNDTNALNLRTDGATRVTISAAGDATFNADVAVNGGDITSAGALNVTPGGALTLGASGQITTLQGNASTKITATADGFTTTVGFTGTATATVAYNFDRTAANGTYTICTTAGNCTGTGGGVTVSSPGTAGTIPVFTGAQTLADSLLSQSGSVVTANGDFNLSTGHVYQINGTQISSANLSNDANLAKLSASQTFTGNTNDFRNGTNSTNAFNVQTALGVRVLTVDTSNGEVELGVAASSNGRLVFANSSNSNTLTIQSAAFTANRTLTLPDVDGIICTDAGNCAGAGATLQTGYNFSTGGTTPKIKVNSTLLGVDIQDADTTIAANLFNVRASNAGGLGNVMFGVGNTGQITMQNSANSTTAVRVLTQGGTSVFTADTQNGQVLLGQSGTLTGAMVFRNAANSNTVTLTSATSTGTQTITLPDATGTVCLSIGNCSGSGSANTLQAAYDAGNTISTSSARDITFSLADTATDANFLVDLQCDTSCSTNGRFAVQDDGTDIVSVSPTNITLGSATTNVPITISSGTGAINIGNGGQARTVNVGTGAAAQTVTLGSTNTTSTTLIQAGTGNITLNSGGTIELQDATNITGATGVTGSLTQTGGAFSLTGNAGSSLTTSSGALTITAATSSTWSTTSGTLTLQSVNSNNNLVINGGSNTMTLATGSAGTITVGSANTTTVNIGAQTNNARTINIGSPTATSNAQNVNIGANASTGAVNINSGTGNINLNSDGTIELQDATNVSGNLATTGTVTVGTLGTTNTSTQLCRNSSNIIAACATTGAGAAFVQGGNSFGATATLGTNDANDLAFETNNATRMTIAANGSSVSVASGTNFVLQGGNLTVNSATDSTAAFAVKTSLGNNAFIVDTLNGRAGIALDTATPTLAHEGLEIKGALRLRNSAGSADTYTTPLGASIGTSINIVNYDPGAYGQLLAMGLSASANSNARVMSLLDARAAGHQPTLAILSPNENEIFGLSWDGTNNTSYVTTTGANVNIRTSVGDVATFNNTAVSLLQDTYIATGENFTVNSGVTTLGGNLLANANVALGDANTDTVTINGVIQGASPLVFEGATADAFETTFAVTDPTADRTITIPNESGTICLQSSSACGFVTGTTADYIQNQNASQQASSNFWISGIGRADTAVRTPAIRPLTDGTTAFQVQGTTGSSVALVADTTNLRIGIGAGTAPEEALDVTGNFQVKTAADDKSYRFRTSGGNLDIDAAGSKLFMSVFANANYGGTQYNYLVLENGAHIAQAIGAWQFRTAAEGTTRHTINGTTGTDVLFNQNGEATDFIVQGDTDANLLVVDGSADRVGIGTATPGAKLDVTSSNTSTSVSTLAVNQSSSGDATIKIATPASSFFVGIDTSDSSKFKLSSATANSGTTKSGYTSWSGDFDSGNQGLVSVTQVTSGVSGGTLNSVSIYIGEISSGSNGLKLGIYTDNGADAPGTLIAGSSEFTPIANSWNTIPLSGSIAANTKYWLAYRIDNSSIKYGFGSGSGRTAWLTTSYASAWPSNYGTPTGTGTNEHWDLHMTYTPTASVDNFAGNLLSITDSGQTTFKNSTNSDSAFQVQNSGGKNVIAIDTTSFNTASKNVITNGDFEDNITGWSIKSAATNLERKTDTPRTGRGALYVVANAANEGVKYNVTLATSQYYTGSFYVKLGPNESPADSVFSAGYSSDGTTDTTNCTATDRLVTSSGWTRFTCNFVTPGSTSGTPYFYIKQSDATDRAFMVDDVMIRLDDFGTSFDASNGSINLQGVVSSPIVMQSATNNSNAFQILNSVGNTVFNVGNDDPTNMVDNSSFETNTDGWGSANGTADFDSSQSLFGDRSLKVATNATANAGATYSLTSSDLGRRVTPGGTYTVSWYAKLNSGTFTDMKARYTRNGSSFVECTPAAQTVVTYGWTRFTCSFTADGTSPTTGAQLRIVQTGATSRIFWIDGVRMEAGSAASAYGNGTISLDAVVNTPLTLRNKDDSTNALTVQSQWGDTLFNIDTANYTVNVGATEGGSAVSSNVEIATGTTNAQTVYMGSTFGASQTVLRGGSGDIWLYTDASDASVIVKSNTNNTQAFTVLNSGDVSVMTVDTTNSRVYVGNPTGDTTGALLVLDTKTGSGDPTGVAGGMYYNSNSAKFRCYENGAWKNCLGFNASLVMYGGNGNGASAQWTNMPAALTEIFRPTDVNSPSSRVLYDLTDAQQIRFQVSVENASSASAELRIQYSTDQSTWNYLDSGNTGLGQNVGSAGLKVSSWSTIASGAKGDVYLRIVGINGDGAADPRFGLIQLQAR